MYWTPKHIEKQKKKKQSKQELFEPILCFYLFVAPVQTQCLYQLYINQALLLNFFLQNINPYFLLPLN